MRVVSLFDGISSAKVALERVGISPELYLASEVDKYAMQVSKNNYPDIVQIGDVTKVNGKTLPEIDLFVGGSPCQGFSFSGKGLNFNDPRSALFFEYVRVLNETKPKYFLLENVVMKKEHQDVISKHLGVEPIMINSNKVSAQNRKRLYWTNIPITSVSQRVLFSDVYQTPTWGDVREYGVTQKNMYYTEKAIQWLARHSRRNNKVLRVHDPRDKMQMLEASHYKKYSSQRFFGIFDFGVQDAPKLLNVDGDIKFEYDSDGYNLLSTDGETYGMFIPDVFYSMVTSNSLRYITPVECERLQTLPDGYTEGVSDTQRYKMLGNGWTVNVVAEIFRGLIQ